MRLHFFTVNNIKDYRKNYFNSVEAKEVIKKTQAQTQEDLDQEFFYFYVKKVLRLSEEIFESKILNETGFPGLRLDFNLGLRLDIPEGNFRVKISDYNSEQIFFDEFISNSRLLSVEQYFIRWQVEVFLNDEKIFSHVLNLEGKSVTIKFRDPSPLGDLIAFLLYIEEFKKVHRCNLSVCLEDKFNELVANLYPDINRVEEVDCKSYATYRPLMIISPFPFVPVDTRIMPLNRVGGMLLGINYLPPKVAFKPTEPPITKESYVCISVQASSNQKCWLYPGGWDIVVDYLKNRGYRVFCIDLKSEQTNDEITVRRPEGAEDFTGDRPLIERANMLYHAEFFVGLGSGLSWLADLVGCPVVMIGGFSQDWAEFYTPYRVSNRKVCNGCFNDIKLFYLNSKKLCPRRKDTPRFLECQKKISPRMVINAIERLIVDKNLIQQN